MELNTAKQKILAVFPGAVEMPDASGVPSADYCIMRPATKEDWPENKWVQIGPYVDGNPWEAALVRLSEPLSRCAGPQTTALTVTLDECRNILHDYEETVPHNKHISRSEVLYAAINDVLSRRTADPQPEANGHCPACANGQDLSKGEGTHREGTVEHPAEPSPAPSGDAALEVARIALEELACLGNGNLRGNSNGNCIAIRALDKIARLTPKPVERVTVGQYAYSDKCWYEARLDGKASRVRFDRIEDANTFAAGLRAELAKEAADGK